MNASAPIDARLGTNSRLASTQVPPTVRGTLAFCHLYGGNPKLDRLRLVLPAKFARLCRVDREKLKPDRPRLDTNSYLASAPSVAPSPASKRGRRLQIHLKMFRSQPYEVVYQGLGLNPPTTLLSCPEIS